MVAMAFVHGHARETGWVVSHYRRPQASGDGQLTLPSPRPPDDDREPDREPDAVDAVDAVARVDPSTPDDARTGA